LEEGDEKVWPDGGGGFSNYFAAPSYQQSIVNNYLATTEDLPAKTYFNESGRAYPDIAALAYGFVIVYNKVPTPGVGGTSCATPTFSGIISLLNDLRLSKGEATLGFLNPWLYQNGVSNPQIFTDITTGSNPGCSTNGFPATKGWDPASGWGSPLYSSMASIV
jgi:tripeptidyl-peptidase-1